MLEAPKTHLHLISRILFSALILLLLLISLWIVLRSEANRIELEFQANLDRLRSHITAQTRTYEVALEGFTAFLEVNQPLELDKVRSYARLLQSYYPDLYAFELAKRVEHSERRQFEQEMQKLFPGFSLHTFDYDGHRRIEPIEERPVYYPVIFVEPFHADYMDVLGLDQAHPDSMLNDVLIRSQSRNRLIASRPVALIDGGKGYLMYRAVGPPVTAGEGEAAFMREAYAMLVVRGDDLVPEWVTRWAGVSLRLTSVMESTVELAEFHAMTDSSALPRWLISEVGQRIQVGVEGQRFWLDARYQPQLSDLNQRHILVYMAFCVFALVMFFVLLRVYRLSDNAQSRWQQFLYQRANFDQLTQLPNMNLLLDRLEQSMRRSPRTGQKLAILYVDLDGFKYVNDNWGHDTGDQLLFKVARRLEASLREQDTVARLHGDEFVVVLPGIESRGQAVLVSEKLAQEFSVPFSLGEHIWTQQVSIGIALFPDDGDSVEELLSVSDRRMYGQKRVHHARAKSTRDAWAD